MGFLRKKPLMLPIAAFMAAVLALGLTLFFLTARNLRSTRTRLLEELYQKGLVLIRSVEAGTRSGMMSMGFDHEFTGRLLREVSGEPDVEFIHLMDKEGNLLATNLQEFPQNIPALPMGLDDGRPRRLIDKSGNEPKMLIFRKFRPPEGIRMGRMRGQMMGRHFDDAPPLDNYVVLALSMSSLAKAEDQALRNAYLTGAILLVAGIGGILFFGVVQNYYLLRRTLAVTRSYADRIVESMADGLVAVDARGKISVINRETSRIFSSEGKNIDGRNVGEVFPEISEEVHRALERGESILERTKTVNRGGVAVRLNYNITPLISEEGVSGAVILLRDVGEMEELREKLKEREKLAALGSMAAAVAHEVRNPLSSIKGLTQLLSGKFAAKSTEKRHTDIILGEVNRLNRFVEELLVFVRPLNPRLEPADLKSTVNDILSLMKEEAVSKRIKVEVDIKDGLPEVLLDRDQFRRAMLNIVINSMEAIGEDGGTIAVGASTGKDGGIVMTVADTGHGLPEDEGERIFESFHSTKPGGTGLGLSIVKQVIDGHGWSWKLENAPGGGAVNIINIPENTKEST